MQVPKESLLQIVLINAIVIEYKYVSTRYSDTVSVDFLKGLSTLSFVFVNGQLSANPNVLYI